MASKLLGRAFDLEVLEPENLFYLREVRSRYKYDESGKRTPEIDGYVYSVISIDTLEDYVVFIPHSKPLVTDAEVRIAREDGTKIIVSFDDAVIRAYFASRTGSYEDSVKAADIHLHDERV